MTSRRIAIRLSLSLALLLLAAVLFHSFTWKYHGRSNYREPRDVKMMFYNVENLFDTIDDPHKNDNEFLPQASRKWDTPRYYNKLNRIYKAIMLAADEQPPVLIGLCEVENRSVLLDLCNKTPLIKWGYEPIHFDSPDKRGIDVAALYNPSVITVLHAAPIPFISDSDKQRPRSRDILFIKMVLYDVDTVHVYVNHWPSRMGGENKTRQLRGIAASRLKWHSDSVLQALPGAKIIIMGDFNDEPHDASLTNVLMALPFSGNISHATLYNPGYDLMTKPGIGSLKYRAKWMLFDQIIVSGALPAEQLNDQYRMDLNGMEIVSHELLLEPDFRYGGTKPFRTYLGPAYHNGYSDHLPVCIDLQYIK